MSRLLEMLLAAAGPREVLVSRSWPMHRALQELYEACPEGRDSLLPPLAFQPDPEVCWRAIGAESGLQTLVARGLLVPQGRGVAASLVVDDTRMVETRRTLMRLSAEEARAIYRAGTRWAALASTASKNLSMA